MKYTALSLRLLFVITVSVITLLLTVTVTYFTSQQYKNEAIAQLTHHIETVTQDFSTAITDYIITENYSSLQDFVLSVQQRPQVKEISVTTPAGIIIADSQPPRLGTVVTAVRSVNTEMPVIMSDFKTGITSSLSPVRLGETMVGWCQLVFDTSYLKHSLAAVQKKAVFWGFVTWLLAVIGASLVSAFIIKPLHTIMGIVDEVSSGVFGRQSAIEGPQEIRQLAEAFNTMTDEIENRETLLKLSENRFRSLVEEINDVVWEIDENELITYVSPAIEHILGYQPDELIGKVPYAFMAKDEAARVSSILQHYAEKKLGFKSISYSKLHKNGQEVIFETSGQPIVAADGQLKGYRGVERDITAKELAADERKQLEQQLQQSQKMESIGRLAGGVAHDFNNILSVINGYSEICLLKMAEDNPYRQEIETIFESGKRAARLTQQLLAFSRKQIVRKEFFALNDEIVDIRRMLDRLLGEDITIVFDLRDDLWPIKADRSQMEQVILNLAVNARDAMPVGGTLTIETKNITLDEENTDEQYQICSGDYVLLAISDTGQGLSLEMKEKIFEPFFTTKEQGKGAGLGLATVYGIIKQSHGEIFVTSAQGMGTTFKIYLPRAAKQSAPVHEIVSKETIVSPGAETIMLVEDEEAVRHMAVELLMGLGYTVLEAENGEDALEIYKRYHGQVDLLLTDVVMPKMSGPSLAKRMQKLRPDMKVLFMSGYTENDIVHHGVLADDVTFLAKPINLKNLSKAVRTIFDLHARDE